MPTACVTSTASVAPGWNRSGDAHHPAAASAMAFSTHGGTDQPLSRSVKLPRPHPVHFFPDYHLGMLAVADITTEDSGAALPAHLISGPPDRCDPSRRRSGAPGISLTCLARFAARQSGSTRHPCNPQAAA